MTVDILLGLQWGDEGKGKIVDYLANQYDLVCRFQGGPNAGHTIKIGSQKFVLHTIPSGIFREDIANLIGNGVVIDPITLQREINQLADIGIDVSQRLKISRKAHLILPTHRYLDAASEASKGKTKIGSTLKGIGPTYMDKTGRNGLRIGDIELPGFKQKYKALKEKHLTLSKIYPEIEFAFEQEEEKWFAGIESLRAIEFVDGEFFVNEYIQDKKRILAEGAQGSMLDIDYGTYPFVTSSNTISAGVCHGLGIAPKHVGEVIGITKSYCTRVGSGPFPTELFDENGEKLGRIGKEFGATTGRPRRCGWIDLIQLKYTIMLSGVTQLVMTKLDVLNEFPEISGSTAYKLDNKLIDRFPFDINQVNVEPVYESWEGWQTDIANVTEMHQLPQQAKKYIQDVEEILGVPFSMISTGPERRKLLIK
jgi:adenylosuccinate synthase